MKRGDLVSDEIVIELIEARLPEPRPPAARSSTAFPRTIAQAEALDDDAGPPRFEDRPGHPPEGRRRDADQRGRRPVRRIGPSRRQSGRFKQRLVRLQRQTAPLLPYYEATTSW
jgi:adenylate kinase